MKLNKFSLVVLLICSTQTFASPWFFGLSGGRSVTKILGVGDLPIVQNLNLDLLKLRYIRELNNGADIKDFINLHHAIGYQGEIVSGYRFGPLSAFSTLSYNKMNYDKVEDIASNNNIPIASIKITGTTSILTAMLASDLNINILPIPMLCHFIGAGVGMSRVATEIELKNMTPTKEWVVSYMAQTGLKLRLPPGIEAVLSFRYFGTKKIDIFESKLNQFQVNLGINYQIS